MSSRVRSTLSRRTIITRGARSTHTSTAISRTNYSTYSYSRQCSTRSHTRAACTMEAAACSSGGRACHTTRPPHINRTSPRRCVAPMAPSPIRERAARAASVEPPAGASARPSLRRGLSRAVGPWAAPAVYPEARPSPPRALRLDPRIQVVAAEGGAARARPSAAGRAAAARCEGPSGGVDGER